VAQIGARVQQRAELAEGVALDEAQLRLLHVAASELVEQRARRRPLGELVVAGLDLTALAEPAREELELPPVQGNAGLLQLRDRRAQAGAARNLHLDGQRAHLERRVHVPRAVAGHGQEREKQELE
jgi:hypothetical protein